MSRKVSVVCDYPFNDTTKWAVTCRVWGLLKYYHPNVTAGHFDWDQVLIDRLDKINDAVTPEQVNIELMEMIRIAGAYEFSKDTAWNDAMNMNVNLCWLDHSFINDSIRQTLGEIASLTATNHWYYIKHKTMDDFNPVCNEKDYNKDVILQYEYRLLALFRFWNVIYYFFPYKYLIDQSWDATLSAFIPQFITASDFPSYNSLVVKIAAKLNDGHATVGGLPLKSVAEKYITLIDSLTIVSKIGRASCRERV